MNVSVLHYTNVLGIYINFSLKLCFDIQLLTTTSLGLSLSPFPSQDADLAAFCPTIVPRVPALIVHCVTEVERRGLTQVGIYRVPG